MRSDPFPLAKSCFLAFAAIDESCDERAVVDKVQEMLGQGDQHNESASEQFKDEQISDGAYSFPSLCDSHPPLRSRD